jgi:purine-binding chemotaxis protein CheW
MNTVPDRYPDDGLSSATAAATALPVSSTPPDRVAAPEPPPQAPASLPRALAANEPLHAGPADAVDGPSISGIDHEPEKVRWLCFLLESQLYAVKVIDVQEVLRVPDIAPVAGAAEELVGVINLRGQIVPVLDLRRRLGLGAGNESAQRRIVVLERQGESLGLLVDAVAEVFLARPDSVQETGLVPGAMPTEWFCGFLRRGSDLVVALDGRRLLAA